jgi:hypothetical protein
MGRNERLAGRIVLRRALRFANLPDFDNLRARDLPLSAPPGAGVLRKVFAALIRPKRGQLGVDRHALIGPFEHVERALGPQVGGPGTVDGVTADDGQLFDDVNAQPLDQVAKIVHRHKV